MNSKQENTENHKWIHYSKNAESQKQGENIEISKRKFYFEKEFRPQITTGGNDSEQAEEPQV